MKRSNLCWQASLRILLLSYTLLLPISCNIQDELASSAPPGTDSPELDADHASDAPDDVANPQDSSDLSDSSEADSASDTADTNPGGDTCSPNCDHGKECREHDDCSSKVCDEGICAEPTCDDGIKNGDETGPDCGGPDCAPCSAGQACQADSDCGETQRSSWDSCQFPSDICAEEGTQSQQITYNECVDNTCTPRQEIKTQTCTRDTTDNSCGEGLVKGSWSACDYGNTCSNSGTRTRSVTTYACSSGTCTSTTTTETGNCTRDTTDETCGTIEYGEWSECSGFDGSCGNDGTRSRTITKYTCANGTCEPTTTTETENCTRNTNGNSCGQGVVEGAWSACDYGSTCSNTGTRTRSVTTYKCDGGSCNSMTTTEAGSCTRNTNGDSCGPGTDYSPWSSCQYSNTCAQSGTKTRSKNTYTCHSGDCISISQQEQEACSRNTSGAPCGSETCDDWPLLCPRQEGTCSSSKERECTQPVCSAGTCSGETTRTETQLCTAISCTCSNNRVGICKSDGLCDCSPGSGDQCFGPGDCGLNEHCCVESNGNYCRPQGQLCFAPI